MGTPQFAVPTLQALIATQNVVGVVTQPDRQAGRGRQVQPSAVKRVAQEFDIPIYQPESLKEIGSAGPLIEWQPDIIVVTAYGQILRAHVLELPARGCLNVHASLLPRWRGASPIQHAILAGDSESGISLMRMDEGLDTGPIYIRSALSILEDDSSATLHDKLADEGADLITRHLDDIVAGRLAAVPQNESLATYAPMIKKTDGKIDWEKDAYQLGRQIRAMTPWPGAYTDWDGKRLKILSARAIEIDRQRDRMPGEVFLFENSIVVVARSGGLLLLMVQLAGKPPMSVNDFVRGRSDFVGSHLGS